MLKILKGELKDVDRRETLRYLGYGGSEPDEVVLSLLDECEEKVLQAQDLRACYDIFPIKIDKNTVNLGFVEVVSADLAKYLFDCESAVVFACTIGAGIDRLISKYSKISPARSAVYQAMGAAAAESWCDEICRSLEFLGTKKSRFSCGYGDLPLGMQVDIFKALSVTKTVGITLSDDCFMTPTKSVTAIVGIPKIGR